MITVAEAFVTLRPDTDGFEREAKTGVGSKLLGIAAAATAAFTAAAGAASVYGVKAAASYEQTTIAFEGILGDATKARDLLGELRDFAAKTPFRLPGLADSAKQLLAVGFTAEDIIPTMTTLGNVAATLGVGEAEIAGVVRALGQMKGKGKATAQELNQISEQVPGFSAVRAIAESLGITTATAFAMMEKGAISADVGIAAILKGMQKFPGAAGAMERQSKTVNGVLSTLKDTATNVAIDFITPYLPAIAAGITSLTGFLSSDLIPALDHVVSFVGAVVDVVSGNLAPVLAGVGVVVGGLVVGALYAMGAALVALISPAVLIVAGLAAVAAGVVYAYERFEGFRTVVDGLVTNLPPLFQSAFGAVQAIVEKVVTVLTEMWDRFGRGLVDNMQRQFENIVLVLQGAFKIIDGIFDFITAVLTGKWGEAWDAIVQIVSGAFDVVNGVLRAGMEQVRAIVEFVMGLVSMAWSGVWNGLKTLVSDVWEGIKSIVGDAVQWVLDKVDTMLGPLDEIIGKLGKVGGGGFKLPTLPSLPSLPSLGGWRAGGGPVDAWTPYMVGERGPELFVPGTSGTVVPNGALDGGLPDMAYWAEAGRVHGQESAREQARVLQLAMRSA